MRKVVVSVCKNISGEITGKKKMDKIFEWQAKKIKYQFYKNSHFKATDVYWRMNEWKKEHANCVDQSILLVSLLRTAGVPSYFIHAEKGKCYEKYGHVYVKAYESNTKQTILDTTASDKSGRPPGWSGSGAGTSHTNGILYSHTCKKENQYHHSS
ncbi:pseudomurein endo-isopeptidase Pei [Methanobrevibacter curvatus]|uniref:Pseudomurein endo-isopeptidase Pei n=2 Tax=Methanobrevibacter curvatus TaxID=49547 RepID=A0A166CKE1_9EURY|nr:pseudomurein endo-isopeptidase Pei [Methanobrevibacter curvatus]